MLDLYKKDVYIYITHVLPPLSYFSRKDNGELLEIVQNDSYDYISDARMLKTCVRLMLFLFKITMHIFRSIQLCKLPYNSDRAILRPAYHSCKKYPLAYL